MFDILTIKTAKHPQIKLINYTGITEYKDIDTTILGSVLWPSHKMPESSLYIADKHTHKIKQIDNDTYKALSETHNDLHCYVSEHINYYFPNSKQKKLCILSYNNPVGYLKLSNRIII